MKITRYLPIVAGLAAATLLSSCYVEPHPGYRHPRPVLRVSQRFMQADLNRDRVVTGKEFFRSGVARHYHNPKAAFYKYDRNRNGVLTPNEF